MGLNMTLLQRIQDVPTVAQIDPAGEPFVPIRPETRDAVVALIETAQVTVREFEAGNPFVGYSVEALEAALAVFTEDKP